mmetsp:Transcript_2975/g.9855  ORF Transcript_2975/g.9855 Transcript_2975/m.9855 type:complete len:279 (-) Transcript_2975:883-1719(-)
MLYSPETGIVSALFKTWHHSTFSSQISVITPQNLLLRRHPTQMGSHLVLFLLRSGDAATNRILCHAQKLQIQRNRRPRRNFLHLQIPVRVLRRHNHPSHRPHAHTLNPFVKRRNKRPTGRSRLRADVKSNRRPSGHARALPTRPDGDVSKLQVIMHRHARALGHASSRPARALQVVIQNRRLGAGDFLKLLDGNAARGTAAELGERRRRCERREREERERAPTGDHQYVVRVVVRVVVRGRGRGVFSVLTRVSVHVDDVGAVRRSRTRATTYGARRRG